MTRSPHILRSKRAEFFSGAYINAIVVSFARGAAFLSSTALGLCHCMLAVRHASRLPTCLRFLYILFGSLALFFCSHLNPLWSIGLNNTGTPLPKRKNEG